MAPIAVKLQRLENSPLKESRIGHLHAHNASPMQQQNVQHLRQLHQRRYFNTKENSIIDGSNNNNNKNSSSNNNNNRYILKNVSAGFGSGGGGVGVGNSKNKHMKRGLEILDFHESWLEEMEVYKDQLNQRRNYNATTATKTHHAHHHHHQQHQHQHQYNTISSITEVQPNQQHLQQQFQQIFQYTTENNCQHESHNCNATLANKPHHIHFPATAGLAMGVIDHYNEETPFEKSAAPTTPLSNGSLRLSKRIIVKKREPQQQQKQQQQQLGNNIKQSQIRVVPALIAASPHQLSNLNEFEVPAPVLELIKSSEKQVSLKTSIY